MQPTKLVSPGTTEYILRNGGKLAQKPGSKTICRPFTLPRSRQLFLHCPYPVTWDKQISICCQELPKIISLLTNGPGKIALKTITCRHACCRVAESQVAI